MRRRIDPDIDRLVSQVPIPIPWSVDGLAAEVGDVVRRPVQLIERSAAENDRIYASVVAGTDAYYIFVRDDLRGLHRDLAVCHELAHILAGHLSTVADDEIPKGISSALPSLSPALISRMLNRECCHDQDQERVAERVATMLLARGRDRSRRETNRVARGFGEALQ